MREGIRYTFSAKPYRSSPAEMNSWVIVSLPKEISTEIRDSYKRLEEGWGRMKVTVKIGDSEWRTSIWFDTKHNTYLLPLKAKIRKDENIELNQEIELCIFL